MALSLLIETSTERSMICFYDGTLRFLREFPVGLNSSKELFPAIVEGLENLNVRASDLNFIAVGVGPGSYTGIRIAAMTAKSIAYGAQVPLIALSSLTCFAPDKIVAGECQFAVVFDAKIGGAYLMTGTKNLDSSIVYTSPPQVLELSKAIPLLGSSDRIITPNASTLKAKFEALAPQFQTHWQISGPDPMHMGQMAFAKFNQGEFSSHSSLDLLYLRKTEAEQRRQLCQESKAD